jgi:hypothetical protein
MLHSRTCVGGMVTAPHHLAAQAGAAVLRDRGNAIEAMVAAAAAIAVVYPHMNGMGGDGFWLISQPGHEPIAIRACGPAAGLADAAFYAEHGDRTMPVRGPRAALTVAGAIGGWAAALEVARATGARHSSRRFFFISSTSSRVTKRGHTIATSGPMQSTHIHLSPICRYTTSCAYRQSLNRERINSMPQ